MDYLIESEGLKNDTLTYLHVYWRLRTWQHGFRFDFRPIASKEVTAIPFSA